jgi:prepilin peptidase CpaA
MLEPLTNPLMITMMLAMLGIALACDLHSRRIPNLLVVAGLVLGLAGHTWLQGPGGLGIAALGTVTGLVCLLPFYISGGMGAGDVKLMAACGAFLGPVHVFAAVTLSLVIGGAIGMGWLYVSQLRNATDDIAATDGSTATRGQPAAAKAIPYALAIGAGVLIEILAAPAIVQVLNGGVAS